MLERLQASDNFRRLESLHAPGTELVIPRSALADLPLFEGLAAEALAALAARGIERRYRTGEVLFRANDPAKGLFVVREGGVRVVRELKGRGQAVHTEGVGGTLGEIPLFASVPYPATATATEPTRCLVFSEDAVRSAIAEDPALALRLLRGLALRVRNLIDRLDGIAGSSVRERLAAFILERSDRTLGSVVSIALTQSQLAEELGTVREVVVKEIAALRRAGALRQRGAGRLEVIDRAVLLAEASGSAPSRRPGRAPGGVARGARPRSGGR